MKGQVSVEMLIVIGLGIAIIGLYTVYSYASMDSYKKGNDEFLMKDSLEKIAETSKFVAFQGEPAKQQVNVCFPLSYKNCTLYGFTISCFLSSGREILQYSDVNITGAMPSSSGCWDIEVQASGDVVNLSVS